jgi:hypothetical protein
VLVLNVHINLKREKCTWSHQPPSSYGSGIEEHHSGRRARARADSEECTRVREKRILYFMF